MQFTLPTTKDEMFSTLTAIFCHYRIPAPASVSLQLEDLDIDTIEFTPLTDEQLLAKAQTLVVSKQSREILERKDKLSDLIVQTEGKITAENQTFLQQQENIRVQYDKLKDEVKTSAVKKGIIGSDVILEKIKGLEKEKGEKLSDLTASHNALISALTAEKTNYQTKLTDADNYFSTVHLQEKQAKFTELKAEQDKLEREIFKYNNNVQERMIRYANSLEQSVLSFNLRNKEIMSKELSKTQLIDLGYYADVISCVYAYYDTLTYQQAYQDIIEEPKLAIYLEDYYDDIVYLYKVRSGN